MSGDDFNISIGLVVRMKRFFLARWLYAKRNPMCSVSGFEIGILSFEATELLFNKTDKELFIR